MFVRGLISFLAASALLVSADDFSAESQSSNSKCRNPEVRKEWRSLSKLEQLAWIASVKCLASQPKSTTFKPVNHLPDNPPRSEKSSLYDDYTYWHMDRTKNIHNTGYFFPWHRNFVFEFTKLLREKCGYFGVAPYWDWTKDASDPEHMTMLDDNFLWGLGTWGDPKNDLEVPDGGFSWGFELAYPIPHRLRRQFLLRPYLLGPEGFWPDVNLKANTSFTAANVKKAVNGYAGNFTAFQIFVEQKQGMHTGAHLIMGGDMYGAGPKGTPPTFGGGPKWTPNEPMFYMHHAMVDKVWFDWQQKSSANAKSFKGGSIQDYANNGDAPWLTLNSPLLTDGLVPPATIGDVMDTQSGKLCYVYE